MTSHRIVLHVGLPKTGTSFLQSLMRDNQALLARRGVHLAHGLGPGLFLAVLYLTDRSDAWGRSAEDGRRAWAKVAGELRGRSGTTVISSETLCLASEEQVARILDELSDHEVDLVLTVRDPARQLPAEWQEGVKHGRRESFREFLDAVLSRPGDDTDEAVRRRHERFWAGQDPVAVLDRWGAKLPAERVHVVTCPPAGAPVDELWARFASVLGVPPDGVTLPGQVNASLGEVQLEVLRRVNKRFVRRGREKSYGRVAKRLYANRILRAQGGQKVALPRELYGLCGTLADEWARDIEARGWQIVGDLGDLRPAAPATAIGDAPEESVSTEAILRSALDATGELLAEVERLNKQNARLRQAAGAGDPAARARRLLVRGRTWVRGRARR
jgi:hypothetical protein